MQTQDYSFGARRPYPTLQTALDRHQGLGPGFDLLRIGLAVAIFVAHAKYVAGSSIGPDVVANALVQQGMTFQDAAAVAFDWSIVGSVRRAYHLALVPMFFALSGFLVAGSAFRTKTLVPFLAFRALRIFPALTVEVILSAVVLGPMFTTLAVQTYLSDPGFFRYFGNILGFVCMVLPGVFTTNPVPLAVNLNLWTLPAEFYCYLITSTLMASTLFFRRGVFTLVVVVLTVVALGASFGLEFGVTLTSRYGTSVVVYYFFIGALFFHWRERIPFGWGHFAAACLVAALAIAVPRAVFVAPVFLTYATIFLGTVSWPRISFIQSGDYSYGVYLYGFPISQALIGAFPRFRGHENLLAVVAGLLTISFAVISWKFIEKPTLRLKRHFSTKKNALPLKREDIERSQQPLDRPADAYERRA